MFMLDGSGVINKIYINAVKIMEEKFGSNSKDLIVCIGPSIRKECFTSKEESFKEKFTKVFPYQDKYLSYEKDNETFHIDLIEIIKTEFEKEGILEKNIHDSNICTRCNFEDFFSYRKARQEEKENCGRIATIVEL